MDIFVRDAKGLPAGAYLSIRAGETRRQALYRQGQVLRFPALPRRTLTVDVFQHVGTSKVNFSGTGAEQDLDISIDHLEFTQAAKDVSTPIHINLGVQQRETEEKQDVEKP